jgi:drug/metabolite transporter (DMT)-like permease
MIQRIQTVYILIAAILISLIFFFPFSSFVIEQDMSVYHLSLKGLIPDAANSKPLFRVIPLICLVAAIVIIDILTIDHFKKRMLQIRFCIANIVLLVGLQGLMFYYANVSSRQLGSHVTYSIIFIFPLISAILTYLAIRGIAKDEALVRSMDRLR